MKIFANEAIRHLFEMLVTLEALSWCKTAVPLGAVLGTLVNWGICALLHNGIGGEFETMPLFALSPVGLGVPLNRAAYERIITHYFGMPWALPIGLLMGLAAFVLMTARLSILGPAGRMRRMAVTEMISEL